MMRRFTSALACAALVATPTAIDAQNRCPAGQSGCTLENAPERIKQRVDEGAQKVLDNSNPQGRVKEVRDTVKDCIECGMDAVKEGMDRLKDPPK